MNKSAVDRPICSAARFPSLRSSVRCIGLRNATFRWLAAGAALLLAPALVLGKDDVFDKNQERWEAMSPEQREQILRKKESFDLLPPAEQERLRQLDRSLHAEPNAEQLLQTLRGYHDWMANLRSTDQVKIKDLPPAERIEEIKKMISQHRQRDIGLTNETRLPPEDYDALGQWAREFGERKREELQKLFPQSDRPMGSGSRRGFSSPLSLFVAAVTRDMVPDEKLELLLTDADLDQLTQSLSPRAKEILDNEKTKRDKSMLIIRWIYTSFMPRVSDAELRKFFMERLDDKQREYVEKLGPIEGRQRLWQMYRESRQRRGPGRDSDGQPPWFPDGPPIRRPEPDDSSREPDGKADHKLGPPETGSNAGSRVELE